MFRHCLRKKFIFLNSVKVKLTRKWMVSLFLKNVCFTVLILYGVMNFFEIFIKIHFRQWRETCKTTCKTTWNALNFFVVVCGWRTCNFQQHHQQQQKSVVGVPRPHGRQKTLALSRGGWRWGTRAKRGHSFANLILSRNIPEIFTFLPNKPIFLRKSCRENSANLRSCTLCVCVCWNAMEQNSFGRYFFYSIFHAEMTAPSFYKETGWTFLSEAGWLTTTLFHITNGFCWNSGTLIGVEFKFKLNSNSHLQLFVKKFHLSGSVCGRRSVVLDTSVRLTEDGASSSPATDDIIFFFLPFFFSPSLHSVHAKLIAFSLASGITLPLEWVLYTAKTTQHKHTNTHACCT